jgi:hypothetical protein
MSALGHKQTFAAQKAMSALPPIATLIAFFVMTALGQKRTLTCGAFDPRPHVCFSNNELVIAL